MLKGEHIYEGEIHRTVRAYSPTGRPKELPLTQQNMLKYARFLQSRKQFMPDVQDGANTTRVLYTTQFAHAHH